MPGKANLRDFRKRVSVLKKQGLLPARISSRKKLDARSALTDQIIRGKKLSTVVRKYDDVATGKLTAVKVSSTRLREFRKAGYETALGRVLIPHSATETVTLKGGEVSIRSAKGIERVQIPIPFQNLPQYFRDIKKNATRIDEMKNRNEYFGFRFFGHNSSSLYANIDLAINDLEKYTQVVKATSRVKQQQIYKNLEIVRLRSDKYWVFPSERRRKMSKEYNRKRAIRFRKKLKRKAGIIQEAYASATAERMREYRKRLKRNKYAYKRYLKDGKARANRSRKLAKKKNRRSRP